MKLLSTSLALLLINLDLFGIPIDFLYFLLPLGSGAFHYTLLFVAISTIYFFLYRTKNLEHLELGRLTKILLYVGSIILLLLFLMNVSGMETSRLYMIFLPMIGKSFIFLGLLSLLLENVIKKQNNTFLYQKIILFLGLVILFSQSELLEHLVSFLISSLVLLDWGNHSLLLFTLKIAMASVIALGIVTILSIFSNILEKIINNKYDVFILISGIVFYLLWIGLTCTLAFTQQYGDINTYKFVKIVSQIFFLIVFLRALLYTPQD